MNHSHISRTLTGIGIIIIGLAALIASFGVFDFGAVFSTWWPTLIIIGGILALVNNRARPLWPFIMIGVGVLWQLDNFGLIHFNVWQLFWPAIIIAIGWSVIKGHDSNPQVTRSRDSDDISVLFGGVDTKNESKDYKGGKVSAILGGGVLDLRHATIKKEATLDIFAMMGGVEIKVPEGWVVRTKVSPILGGVDNKAVSLDKPGAPVLTITGTAIMGGVEIKH
jgi:predicted membrane protein